MPSLSPLSSLDQTHSPPPPVCSIGRWFLSAGVFERCTSTRSQFWTTWCLYSFRGDLLQKWWAKPQPKHGKSPLTFDVRRSKTSLLQIFSIFKRHARSTSSEGKKGYLSVKRLYHSREFKQKLIKWWSIIDVLQYMAIILNYRFSSNRRGQL